MAQDETEAPTKTPYLTDWNLRHQDLFGQHTVNLGHTLHESPLFADAALAKLIENAPPGSYHVNTMDPKTHDPKTRKEGQIKGLSGLEVLDAVKNGTIWIILRDPGATDPAYRTLLTELYDELRERTGQKLYREKMQILISSPKVQVYYHCDVAHDGEPAALMVCTACGTVAELAVAEAVATLAKAADDVGFRPERTVIEMNGQCRRCQEGH